MPSPRIHEEYRSAVYFLTFTVKNWYYLFDRYNRFEILADSLIYCRQHKQLKIYAYVLMLNHMHLVVSSPNMISFVRDFKKFTSKAIQKNIVAFERNLLKLFENKDGSCEIWQRGNMPKLVESDELLNQKIEYIHFNPVDKQYVQHPEDWVWSSANPHGRIPIDPLPA
ncbi:MAG: transposase [Patescibacteria group bacterium]